MTEKTRYTPGPWHANTPRDERYADDSTVRDCANGYVVAVVRSTPNGAAIPNARLIAAAPDLYEALRLARNELLEWACDYEMTPEGRAEHLETMRVIDDALDKAVQP